MILAMVARTETQCIAGGALRDPKRLALPEHRDAEGATDMIDAVLKER